VHTSWKTINHDLQSQIFVREWRRVGWGGRTERWERLPMSRCENTNVHPNTYYYIICASKYMDLLFTKPFSELQIKDDVKI
jgi:hypothetical protein